MTDMYRECITPLIDLLRRVPADARVSHEHSEYERSYIDVGRLCAEALAEIERLRGLQKDAARYRWLRSQNMVLRHGCAVHAEQVSAEALDRAIDARMKAG